MEIEAELRVASDRILSTLEQLDTLESEKRTLKPESEHFQTLAKEIERLAAVIYAQSHTQQKLGERAQAAAARTGADIAPIDDASVVRELPVILAEWREAERRLAQAAPDSADRALASADVGRLREEYQRAYRASQDDK